MYNDNTFVGIVSDDLLKVIPLPDLPDHIRTAIFNIGNGVVDRFGFVRTNNLTQDVAHISCILLVAITLGIPYS
jgi:hypothetical protein